jgi:hypothetical protein
MIRVSKNYARKSSREPAQILAELKRRNLSLLLAAACAATIV